MKRVGLATPAIAILLGMTVTSCGSSDANGDDKLAVVATTTQVADFARNIGGDHVRVTQILKPNVDAHDFEPSPKDIKAIGEADLILKNGVGLEEWLDDTIKSAGFDGITVDTSKGIKIRNGEDEHEEETEHEAEEEHDHEHDPHIWHNPQNAKMMAENIQKALTKEDSANSEEYRQNYTVYSRKLDELDAESKAKIATIPADQRKLVTNHSAFSYYTEHYGIEYVGSVVPSFDSSAELSAAAIDELVTKIKETNTKAIFSEASLRAQDAQTIGREAGVKVIAGQDALYGDALGPKGSAGDTYLKAQKHNTNTIVEALK